MTKKEVLVSLEEGPVLITAGQFTRNSEIVVAVGKTVKQMKKLDKGTAIGVLDIGSNELTTVTAKQFK
jgi:hypothetical protein